ncbi:MAG: hypothetical protein PHC52_12415 [Syntrophales bacterium]|nr:nucleotide-binding protein [Candidatus ainarchaeum sp.]MDD5533589.1 hypothetical protein [Syntrophales bacterium]
MVLDTNFLLLPLQFGVNIFKQVEELMEAPHEFVVPSGVVGELKVIARGRGRDGSAARFALKLLDSIKARHVPSTGNVDDWIVEYAAKEGAVVATNDMLLRNRLKKAGVKMIALRSRARLGVV